MLGREPAQLVPAFCFPRDFLNTSRCHITFLFTLGSTNQQHWSIQEFLLNLMAQNGDGATALRESREEQRCSRAAS